MRRFFTFALFLSCLACFGLAAPTASFAKAKSKKATPHATAKTSESMAHPVFNRDGSFGFCLAQNAYADGRKLTIARSPKDEINLGVTIQDAGFKAGHKYDLTLSLDNNPVKTVRAVALGPTDLLLQMGADATFQTSFSAAKTLGLAAGGNKMSFALPPMSKLWSDLGTCLKTNKGKVDEAAKKAEEVMPEPLKALLVTAGFQDVVPLSMEKIPPAERPADFVWEMNKGKVTGGVRERIAPEDKDLAALAGLHIEGLRKRCNGPFKTSLGSEDKAPGLLGRTAEASCELKEGDKTTNLFVAMYFYLTAKHRFTVFSFEADSKDKDAAVAASKALRTTMLNLAQQTAAEKQEAK